MNAQAERIEDDVVDDAVDVRETETDEVESDDGFEIEVVDDVPENQKPRKAEDAKADVPEDDEIETYSESVQKRIKQLRFEYHEAERQKQEAIRLREEAINYAKQVSEQNKKLQDNLQKNQGFAVEQTKGRLAAELEKAKATYKQAYEAGDPDQLLEAQANLTRLQNEQYRWDNYRPAPKQEAPEPEFVREQPQQQQAPELTESQRRWLSNNDWYGKDRRMTSYALGIHEELVYNGVAPDSEKYYAEIDKEMRKTFPTQFSDGEEVEVPSRQKKPASVVAPAARSAKTPRKIRLTSSQVAIAKRLGLSNEQYAAQLLKEQQNG